jgi:hypothetical protein
MPAARRVRGSGDASTAANSTTATSLAPGRLTLERWATRPAAVATGNVSRVLMTNNTPLLRQDGANGTEFAFLRGGAH